MRLVHFANLKADLAGEMRKLADFLEIEVDEAKWPEIVEHCTFEYMKANGDKSVPLHGALWEGGAKTFIHKGTNGRWKTALTAEDNAIYEAKAKEHLGEDCARWLATGVL